MGGMARAVLAGAMVFACAVSPTDEVCASAEEARLTPERLTADPRLAGPRPSGLKFSPDGTLLTFLRGKADNYRVQDVWALDLATGEERVLLDAAALSSGDVTLSETEKARRERQRISARGIVEYTWDRQGRAVLAPVDGDLFYANIQSGDVRRLTRTEAFETDAKISPKGKWVSYIWDQDLWVFDLEKDAATRLTIGGGPISHGVAEFVAQEEMNRYTGYWWSPDDRYIAYTRVDETPVEIVDRFDIGADGVEVRQQRYPYAGTSNALVSLHVLNMETRERVDVDLGSDTDIYLARVNWLPEGEGVVVQRQNRAQTRLDVLLANPATGETKVLFSEETDTWINLHKDFKPVKGEDLFLWTSERSGFRHIYVYGTDGSLVRQVTSGDWAVSKITGVDAENGLVYFEGFKDGVLEKHLYVTFFRDEGPEARRVTAPGQWWSVDMNKTATAFVGTASSATRPPNVGLYGTDGRLVRWIEENDLAGNHPYAPYRQRHVAPVFGTIPAEDGTVLHYSLFKPSICTDERQCPAIVLVYGGPRAQSVRNTWPSGWIELLVDRGFVVFQLDNRGSYNRGKAFENVLHRRMGHVEVQDQIRGLSHLKKQPFVDGNRTGVFGWSYGGYMVLMLMTKHPEAFAAGVSGAPVSDWLLYDTHYTERYLGHPDENADGYTASSVFPQLTQLSRPSLMIHGMADDNVVFINSTRVYAKLQEENIPFEVMVYPGQRHGISGRKRRAHMYTAVLNFMTRTLKPVPVP